MSGIAATVRLDGGPGDAALLERMTACMAFRGPDGTRTWSEGPAGLGHALLRTGDVAREADQPLTLDGATWIAADARIDGRGELIRELRGAGRGVDGDASAAELILHAYAVWGVASPERLLGDFAFAVWDAPRRRLFCARDLFGVKPLFHARAGAELVVSNTLGCVRLHPGVSDALDDAAVADFLVHGHPEELDLTVFRDVRALPPGHALVAEDGEVRVRRWGALPTGAEPLRYRRVTEYVEHFLEVLGEAVRDRLPEGAASLFLSGGRDSTAIGALAREAVDRGERRTELRAFTAVYDRLLPDEERRYTRMAAGALRIPVDFTAVDGYEAFERWETPALRRPQPTDAVLGAIEADQLAQAAAHARVLFTGQGGDAALRETRSRLTKLVAAGHPLRALREAAEYAWWHGRL
ncbi:MAG TPA: asparagine synthase-related protein, partial [Longimicrobium sp.]|nr:asparagine synthase-related protein [Longimicrobium sp.]